MYSPGATQRIGCPHSRRNSFDRLRAVIASGPFYAVTDSASRQDAIPPTVIAGAGEIRGFVQSD